MHLILSHEQSDFDAIAAMLGAWLTTPDSLPVLHARLNRNVRDYLKVFHGELPFGEISELPPQSFTAVTLVDSQALPTVKGIHAQTKISVFDHHTLRPGASENWEVIIEPTGACTTLFVELIQERGIKLTVPQATLLLLGIYEDTGSLTYSLTTPRDVYAAAFLLEQNASLKTAARYLNPPLSDSQSEMYDILLTHAHLYEIKGQRIIISSADATNMEDEISSVVHKLRDFLEPDGLIVITQIKDGFRLVARSTTDEINVAELTSHFCGGGHGRAAAAFIQPKKQNKAGVLWSMEGITQEVLSILPDCIHPALTVGQIMSHNPILLQADTPAEKAAHLMQRYGYEGFPVMDNDQVVGLLTRRIVDRTLAFKLNLTAGSLMEPGSIILHPDNSIEDLQQTMTTSGWGQIPVLDPQTGKIIGIVTRTDLIKTISNHQEKNASPTPHNLAARLEAIISPGKLALLKQIAAIAEQKHIPLYIVGGFVRDLLLNRPAYDFDLVVEGDAIALGHKLKETFGGKIISHSHFGTAKWQIKSIRENICRLWNIENPKDIPDSIDLISARIEFYDRPTALPTVERSSIKLDLHRRDFSINTLALRLDGPYYGDLYDYWGGMNDLRQGVIRVLHSLSFVDDPTRMLRAVRFEQRFHFKIENRTLKLIKEAHGLVDDVSGDRLRHELDLILGEADPMPTLQRADHLGLLAAIHPGLKWSPDYSLWAGSLLKEQVPDEWQLDIKFQNLPLRLIVFYILWFSNSPIKTALQINKRLRFNHIVEDTLVQLERIKPSLVDLPTMKPSQVYSSLAGCSKLTLYCAFKVSPTIESAEMVKKYVLIWQSVNPTIGGKDLAALNIAPGPVYKKIINRLRDAWLDGIVTNPDQEQFFFQEIVADEKLSGAL